MTHWLTNSLTDSLTYWPAVKKICSLYILYCVVEFSVKFTETCKGQLDSEKEKNSAYGGHWISGPMRRVGPKCCSSAKEVPRANSHRQNPSRKWVFFTLSRMRGGGSIQKIIFFLIVSSQANIMNTFFNQKSPRPPEVGVLWLHRHTEGHWDY